VTAVRDLIAVDIGNSRLKVGRFESHSALRSPLPEPVEILTLPIINKTGEFDAGRFRAWCDEHVDQRARLLVASVHRGATSQLEAAVEHLTEHSPRDILLRPLTYRDVPLTIRVSEPARVGIDRVLAAFTASRLRTRDRSAIIVSLGTAITVDLLEADGAFAGGAILPGIAMSARALAEDTDALPHVNPERLEKPPALGTSTTTAIESGLYWGAVGAIRELISQLSATLTASPELFLTGGAAWQVADVLTEAADFPVRHVPHLVLAGIALVDAEAAGSDRG
jgi:type III pantothenate kinase